MVHGVAMTIEHIPILKNLSPELVIDVGANKGQFTLMCRELFPDAAIVAFEPLNMPTKQFKDLFNNDHKVTLHQNAIGQTRGSETIYISRRMDSSSLLPISKTQSTIFPGTELDHTTIIKIAPLSDFSGSINCSVRTLLKIDVQGFELEVLRGCGTLLQEIDYCYVECSYQELYKGQPLVNDILDFMHSAGFILTGVFNQTTDKAGHAVQGDFLFISND